MHYRSRSWVKKIGQQYGWNYYIECFFMNFCFIKALEKEKTIERKKLKGGEVSTFKGKRDGSPKFLTTTYWKMIWSNTTPILRFENFFNNLLNKKNYFHSDAIALARTSLQKINENITSVLLSNNDFNDYTNAHLNESINKIQSVYKAQTVLN